MKNIVAVLLATAAIVQAADQPNYDEAKVPAYTLPDPFVCNDGTKIREARQWREKRRTEILELFRNQVYGRSPARPDGMRFDVVSVDRNALNGLATRKQIVVSFGPEPDAAKMHILLYIPNNAKKPVPVFVNVNFDGNHGITSDPGITLVDQWVWDRKTKSEVLTPSTDETRGKAASRYPMELILSRGYALATIPRADIEPDYDSGWKHGVRGYLLKKSGKREFAADDWGAIGAWAWGCSRALDYLETDKDIDAKHAAVMGHSRMGKAALWAGAQDERFGIVISNNSGEGGAALARRCFGETTFNLNDRFPHWFCANFKQYSNHEEKMPTDQHELLALVAPRALYVASAEEDRWADPRGEFLSAKAASPVYQLLGLRGLGVEEMPGLHQPVGDMVRYHIRAGKHDVTNYDWEQYLDFADKKFRR